MFDPVITETTPFTLLADLVQRIDQLRDQTDRGADALAALTRESLYQLADQARTVVNSDLARDAFAAQNERRVSVAESKYGTAAAATVAGLASPPAPGTGFYPPHTAPAPVAPTEVRAPFPGGDRDQARQYWVMDEQYPTGHGPDFGVLDSLQATPEDDLGNEGFTVSVADYGTDKTVEVQADMWFHSRGFFKLSTSDALPADVMARALAAAYLVVRDAAYARFDNLDKHPADR